MWKLGRVARDLHSQLGSLERSRDFNRHGSLNKHMEENMTTLFPGQSLRPGQSLQSNNKLHTLIMQTDGNVFFMVVNLTLSGRLILGG